MDAIDNHVTSKPLDGETVLDGLLIIVDSKEAVERSKVHNYWQFSYKASDVAKQIYIMACGGDNWKLGNWS